MTISPKCSRSPSSPNNRAALRQFVARCGCFVLCWLASSFVHAQETVSDSAAGQTLAEQLRSSAPDENSEIHGTLHIRAGDFRTNVSLTCRVEVTERSWRTVYITPSERLIVVHFTNAPNDYFEVKDSATNSIPPSAAAVPIAGSDFTLADLGLEFLHWPIQEQRKGEMRLGQPCYVLDSSNPQGNGIIRIRSFIDKRSDGIILADAFDAAGRLVKEFSLHGSFFRKVHGQWRLEKMEMSDKQKHSQTIIQFDISP